MKAFIKGLILNRLILGVSLALILALFGQGFLHAGESPSEKLDLIRRVISERGEYDLAERQLRTFVDENKTKPIAAEGLVLLGYCQDKQRKNQDAAASYAKVVAEYPEAPAALRADASLGAADAFYRLGRYEDAAKNYENVLQLSEKTDQLEAAMLWRGEARYRKGMEETEAGRNGSAWLSSASDDFINFISKYPESKNLPSAYYGAAFSAFDNEDYEKALVFFNRFNDNFSDDRRIDESRYYAGESLYRLNRYEEAKYAFNQILSDTTESRFAPDARAGVAWADMGLGNKAEAAAGFEEAAKLATEDRDLALSYLYDAGCAWREAGDAQKAAGPLMEVAKASEHELNGLAWFRLGTLWQERAKEAREREDAAKTDEEKTRYVELRRKMGADAVGYFRKAIDSGKLGSEEIEALSIMGEVYLDSEQYEEATKVFADIAARWPKSERAPWALYHEALAFREIGMKQTDKQSRQEYLIKAAASLRSCLEYPNAKVRLQAAWALSDYLTELGDTTEANAWRKWLANEGMEWARNWRGPDGKGDSGLEVRAKQYAADSLFQLGEGFYFASDLPRASGYYQDVVSSHADTPQAAMSLLRLGEISEHGGDPAGAAKRYTDAIAISESMNPLQVKAARGFSLLRLGILRLREGQRLTDQAEKRAKFQEALRQLNAAEASAPEGMGLDRLYYYLAETKYGLGLKQESTADYEKSISVDAEGALADAAWFGLAWALRDLKQYDRALTACNKVIEAYAISKLRPDAYVLAAAINREKGDARESLSMLEAFLLEYPHHELASKAELERASALDEVGRHQEAAAAFQQYLANYPESPDTPQALYQLSWALWNQIKPKVAEAREKEREWKALTGGLEIGELPEEDREAAAAALLAMQDSSAAVKTAEDEILTSLRSLTARYPDYPVADAAWLRIGEILYDRDEYQQAHDAYSKALQLAESKKSDLGDKAQYRLAWSLQRLAEAAEKKVAANTDGESQDAARKEMWDKRLAAIEAFQAIRSNYPQSELFGEACFRAAELRRRSGQDNVDESKRSAWYQTAIQLYRQAIEKGGKDAPYLRAAEYGLAFSLLLDKKNSEARERFQKFLSDYQDGPFTQEAYWGLGQSNLELGAYAEAAVAFERALSLDKATETAAKSRYGLGLTAVQAGDREKARLEFLAVDSLYPNYPEWAAIALVRAAKTALQDGYRDKAIGDVERVLARYPETAAAEEARNLQVELSSGNN